MRLDTLSVENELKVTTKNFIKDFLKMSAEIKTEEDIVNIWHVEPSVAKMVFQLFSEIVFGDLDDTLDVEDESGESDPDELDLSRESD